MKQIRSLLRIVKRGYVYDVHCSYCNKVSKAWDYRTNALLGGIVHVVMRHVVNRYHMADWVEEDT